jgi:hypothetical protein
MHSNVFAAVLTYACRSNSCLAILLVVALVDENSQAKCSIWKNHQHFLRVSGPYSSFYLLHYHQFLIEKTTSDEATKDKLLMTTVSPPFCVCVCFSLVEKQLHASVINCFLLLLI